MKKDLLGRAIRESRLANNYSQEALAESVGITPTHMKHIESGHRLPSIAVLYNIVITLRMSLDEVFLPQEAINSKLLKETELLLQQCNEHELRVVRATINALLQE